MPAYPPQTGRAMHVAGMPWAPIQPDASGDFRVSAGRYAALVSVSKNYSKDDLTKFLTPRGWDITYLWEWGDPNRATFEIDDWLASLPADTRDNHRWVYGEANLSKDDSFGKDSRCIAFVCTTVYHVAVAYVATPGQDGGQPSAPPPPTAPGTAPGTMSASAMLIPAAFVGALFVGVLLMRRG